MSNKLSLHSVNTRIDNLACTFQNAMDDFKSQMAARRLSLENKQPTLPNANSDEEFMKNFEEFQRSMNNAMSALKADVQKLNMENRSHQLKRNLKCLLVHGMEENKTKTADLYESILNIFQSKLGVELTKNDIDVVYRLGKSNDAKKSKFPRPILVEFCHRWKRDLVFFNKKLLKHSKIMLTELLTDQNLNLFKQVKEQFKKSCWTYRGLVYVEFEGVRKLIKTESDLDNLSSDTNSV